MSKAVSACGLDCLGCECYLATRSGDLKEKEAVAKKWSKQYEAQLTPDDIECDGCLATGKHFAWCKRCPIRACVTKKEYVSCADCDDFPCQTGEFLYNGVPEAKANIEKLRTE